MPVFEMSVLLYAHGVDNSTCIKNLVPRSCIVNIRPKRNIITQRINVTVLVWTWCPLDTNASSTDLKSVSIHA